ncbi:hypothetical protein PVBG_05917 [Plasmodium vivax Brazil I]|uniref:Uncharacterized protein n=1 Tax=Plasmodium vivax (strain Brazil I) TaxID=1033975 RepID=A0A0J9T304_PLAV1|nr:hypothetical protein PVBG_05917 [Plasmodium vivax Brazil I]
MYDDIYDLNSYRRYIKLDQNFISYGNYDECSKLDERRNDYSKPYALCLSLTGNLNNYDKIENFGDLNDYKCTYLNLWVYDRLSKIEDNKLTDIKSILLKIWEKTNIFKVCSSNKFVSFINEKDDIKAKRLYDYALNYDKLHSLYDIGPSTCTKKISQYIEKSQELIRSIKDECPNDKNFKTYCTALNEITNIYDENNLLNLKCKKVEENNIPDSEEEEEKAKSMVKPAGHPDSHPVSAGDHAERGRGDTGSKSNDLGHSKKNERSVDDLPGSPSAHKGPKVEFRAHDTGTLYGDQTNDFLGDPNVSPSPDTPKTTAIALPALSALSLGFMLFKVYMNKILILIYYS